MKRLLLIVFSVFAVFGLSVSCGDDDDNDNDDDSGGNDDDDTGDDDNDDQIGDDDDSTEEEEWTDSDTGLTWQATPPSDYMNFAEAELYCDTLSLAGSDGWRLPSVEELRTLIRGCVGTVTGGDCPVKNNCLDVSCSAAACTDCLSGEGPNGGCYGIEGLPGECTWVWSRDDIEGLGVAWAVDFASANINYQYTYYEYFARCVR